VPLNVERKYRAFCSQQVVHAEARIECLPSRTLDSKLKRLKINVYGFKAPS
jgi:hypothetical protein